MCVRPRAPPPDSTRPILGRGLAAARRLRRPLPARTAGEPAANSSAARPATGTRSAAATVVATAASGTKRATQAVGAPWTAAGRRIAQRAMRRAGQGRSISESVTSPIMPAADPPTRGRANPLSSPAHPAPRDAGTLHAREPRWRRPRATASIGHRAALGGRACSSSAASGSALFMTGLPLSPAKFRYYGWHKWIGITVFLVAAARLAWRAAVRPPPLPATMPAWQARAPRGCRTGCSTC